MLTLNVNGNNETFNVNIPTSMDEITSDYIKEVTKHITIDANYTLIGLVFKEKLSTLLFASSKNKKNSDIAVVPIFIKAGETNSNFINKLKIKDTLIISPSDVMLGHHISAPNNLLNINYMLDILRRDSNIYNKMLCNNEQCYFIEFKLVPNCNIHGSYNEIDTYSFVNPFVTKIVNKNNSNNID